MACNSSCFFAVGLRFLPDMGCKVQRRRPQAVLILKLCSVLTVTRKQAATTAALPKRLNFLTAQPLWLAFCWPGH